MTLDQITIEMKSYNGAVAYGSECNAWQDYHADCHEIIGVGPQDDEADDMIVPEEFADYWLKVARGESADYDAETGEGTE